MARSAEELTPSALVVVLEARSGLPRGHLRAPELSLSLVAEVVVVALTTAAAVAAAEEFGSKLISSSKE
jgi:hypothetical protein